MLSVRNGAPPDMEELSEDFSNAAAALAAANVDISDALRLKFYALYKQATVGPCNIPQPSLLNFVAKAKRKAWMDLNDLSKMEAMAQYTSMVRDIMAGSMPEAGKDTSAGNEMAPVVSRPVNEETPIADADKDIIDFVIDGDKARVQEILSGGIMSVDFRDPEGRTALHFAADRGHVEIVELLCDHFSADVSARDSMGCTALHNACCNDHLEVAQILLERGADPNARDIEGETPADNASEAIVDLLQKYS